MKKVFTYLAFLGAAAFMVFSCSPLPEDCSHVEEVVAAPAVTITVSGITDNSATVTIAPDGAANYYAYVVDQSAEAAELDAKKLYSNGYSSVANGLVKYTTTPSTTVELEDLKPNKVYQVYAVAGSTTGVVGVIAVESFLTTDTGTPTPGTPTKKENVLSVAFSENVTYDATKPATAYYYAYNAAEIDNTDPKKPVLVNNGKVGDAKVDVAVKGATVTFTVTLDGTNPLPAGAYYTIGYPAGAFVDAVGNPCPARSHLTGLTSKGELGFGGFYGRVSTKAFDLEYDKEKETALPNEPYFSYGIPEGTEFYEIADDANATMTVIQSSKTKVSTTVYDLENDYDWEYDSKDNAIVVYYPDDIDINPGDNFKINIAAGAIQDVYGNTSNAFEVGYLCAYGYKLEDVYGTYQNSGRSIYTGYNEKAWALTIAKSDDLKKGNVMFTEYYGYELEEPFYGNFNTDTGVLTFPMYYNWLGGTVSSGYYFDFYALSYGATKAEPEMTMTMTEAGKFTTGSDRPGYYYDVYAMPESGNVEDIPADAEPLGYDYNFFYPIFEKVVVEPTEVTTSSVKSYWKSARTPKEIEFTRLLAQ